MTTVDIAAIPHRSTAERRERLLQWADLTRVLAVSNFKRRYLRSKLGIAWAIVSPTLQAAVLSVVFIKIFHVTKVPHYPLYVLSGIMAWQFFQQSCSQGTSSIVDNGPLVKKVAVPKVIFPLATVVGLLLVFLVQSLVLFVGAAVFGTLSLKVFYLLLAIPIECALAASVAILCTSIHVSIRDIKFVIDAGLMMFFYLTPVIWDITRLPASVRSYVDWNPVYGVLTLVRAAFLDRSVDWNGVLSAVILTAAIAALGGWLFRRRSADFSDLV